MSTSAFREFIGKYERLEEAKMCAEIFGVSGDRFNEIEGGARLTQSEFERVHRCPARLVPLETIEDECRAIMTQLKNEIDVASSTELENANGYETPAGELKSFRRISMRWLNFSIIKAKRSSVLLDRIVKAALSRGWSEARAVATSLYALTCSPHSHLMFDKLVEMGVLLLDTKQWISVFKQVHTLVKVRQVWIDGSQLTVSQACELMYLHELVGRGKFMDEAGIKRNERHAARTHQTIQGMNSIRRARPPSATNSFGQQWYHLL